MSKVWRVSLEGTGSGFGQERGKSEKSRSLKATGEGKVRVRREDLRPAGVERGGERRWAWVATTGTEQTGRRTGAKAADLEALGSYNCDSEVGEEGLDASNDSATGVWSTEERKGADGYSLASTHSSNGSNSLFNHPSIDSPHQRAPAERPLSPACEHTNTLLTPDKLSDLSLKLKHTRYTSNTMPLPWQNAQQGVPSSSCRQTEPLFAANANRRELSNAESPPLPHTTPITQNGCKLTYDPLNIISENPAHTQVHNHVEVKAKTSLLAQGVTSTDSLSYTMDPLSISLLQVDQQVATASFLQGEQNNTRPLENERGEHKGREDEEECLTCAKIAGKVVEDEDAEFHLSLLELPHANTHFPPTPDTVTAANHSKQRKDMCFATYEHRGIGMMKLPIPEVMLSSLRDPEYNQKPQTTPAVDVVSNKDPATHLKSSTCASVETSLMQSISSLVQHSRKTGTQNLMTPKMPPEYAHKVHNKLAFPISTPQSLQPNVPTESNSEKKTSNLQIRPTVHPSTLEDVYHSQWHVVQAHWEQLEEMETLCRKDGRLLGQQPDMAFGEYVHKLGEIMERKARCVHSMIAQLQPYLKTNHCNQPHNQGEDNDDQIT
ncbi:uncharacterized protein [Pagrus major]|uniref:uncharacterized protein n=1 Tax=Pagrus major TaxID=143350 RepID=UPI003CC8569E